MALQNSLPPSPLSYFIMLVVKLRSYEGWASMSDEAGGGGGGGWSLSLVTRSQMVVEKMMARL